MTKFPKPKIPIQPVLSRLQVSFSGHNQNIPSILDAKHMRFVTSGRIAITLALGHAGINAKDAVLIPAYHCSSMVEPVVHYGAEPVFYRINTDTSVDLEDVKKKITPDTKILMVTHYFGFHQDIEKIRLFCDNHNLLLLEDCAHCFFGKINESVGTYGDYSIASIMKFFPTYDGGCLASKYSLDDIRLENPKVAFQLKSLINCFERSFEYKRLMMLNLLFYPFLFAKNKLWTLIKSKAKGRKPKPIGPQSSEGGYDLDESWINKRISWYGKYILQNSNYSTIVERRRANYKYYDQQIKKLKGIRPLYSNLPDNVVPYVYPVVVSDPDIIFEPLKSNGVPIIRFGEFLWDGVDETVCEVSDDLSKRVFQFPCHQELRLDEIDWVISQIENVLQ